ncbi:hypothetical protein D3C71_1775740 [compost metagenome]
MAPVDVAASALPGAPAASADKPIETDNAVTTNFLYQVCCGFFIGLCLLRVFDEFSQPKLCEVVVHLRLSIADENCPIIYHATL